VWAYGGDPQVEQKENDRRHPEDDMAHEAAADSGRRLT
jgi:hypothetical protein